MTDDNVLYCSSDKELLALCNDVQQSSADSAMEAGPTTASVKEGRRIRGVLRRILKTKVTTLTGLKAKASVYIEIPSEELAEVLALDILAFNNP